MSLLVYQTEEQGCRTTGTELMDLLANLDIIPEKPVGEAANQAAQVWVEAMRRERGICGGGYATGYGGDDGEGQRNVRGGEERLYGRERGQWWC